MINGVLFTATSSENFSLLRVDEGMSVVGNAT